MTSYERLTQKRTDKPPNDPSVERWVDGLAKYPRSNFCLLQQAVAIDACQVPLNELLTILALTRRTSQAENMQAVHNARGSRCANAPESPQKRTPRSAPDTTLG